MSPEVQIKGISEGLLVSVSDGDWLEAEQALYAEIGRPSVPPERLLATRHPHGST